MYINRGREEERETERDRKRGKDRGRERKGWVKRVVPEDAIMRFGYH